MKCDIINDVKLFLTDILSQIFEVIQSDVALHKQYVLSNHLKFVFNFKSRGQKYFNTELVLQDE